MARGLKVVWLLVAFVAVVVVVVEGSDVDEGLRYTTTHSSRFEMDERQVGNFKESVRIKEWHFHVYFHLNTEHMNTTFGATYKAAMELRRELVTKVKQREFIVILGGITKDIFPQLDDSKVPPVNTQPIGPHPVGSYEVWCPEEYFAKVMSFLTLHRGELSILVHPLTIHEVEDHTGRAFFLGPSFRINPAVLTPELRSRGSEYPELGLGYANTDKVDIAEPELRLF